MPAAFAHDLYGRKVYLEVNPKIKQIIRKERYCFLLGVHGPDVLFFYRALGKNRVNQKGVRLHREAASGIFQEGRKEILKAANREERNALMAYLLGISCHYALDHSLHGYINRKESETGITHAQIETELERRLLTRENMRPLHSNLTCHLKNTKQTRMAASRIFKEDMGVISEAIASFRTMNRLFINSSETTKKAVCAVLKLTGNYSTIYGMLMRKNPVPGCGEMTDYLEQHFFEAVPYGAKLAEGLYRYLNGHGPLPEEFGGNFNGEAAPETAVAASVAAVSVPDGKTTAM